MQWRETWLLSDRGWVSVDVLPPPLNLLPLSKHSSRALIVLHKVPRTSIVIHRYSFSSFPFYTGEIYGIVLTQAVEVICVCFFSCYTLRSINHQCCCHSNSYSCSTPTNSAQPQPHEDTTGCCSFTHTGTKRKHYFVETKLRFDNGV